MDTLAALLSGFVAGAAVGVLGLGIFGSLLVTVPTTNWLRRQFPDPSSWVMVSLAAAFAAQAGSALLGLLMGVALLSLEGDSFGLGSPSWRFTTGIVIGVVLLCVGGIFWQPSIWRRFILIGVLAAGSFGWMLPHMALG